MSGKVVNEFLIGADPEFAVREPATGNAINLRDTLSFSGELGYDHGGYVAEVRPKPSKRCFEVVQTIQKLLLKKMPKEFETLHNAGKWESGAFKASSRGDGNIILGGHLHFGLPLKVKSTTTWDENDVTNPRVARGIKNLDWLTKMLEHLDVLPTKESAARRKHPWGYGKFGDVRPNGPEHFEYRSMCSWLFHPHVAMTCLTLGKLVMRYPISIESRFGIDPLPKANKLLVDLITRGAIKHGDEDCQRIKDLVIKGDKFPVFDPTVDFRERWVSLGLGEDE